MHVERRLCGNLLVDWATGNRVAGRRAAEGGEVVGDDPMSRSASPSPPFVASVRVYDAVGRMSRIHIINENHHKILIKSLQNTNEIT